MVTSLYIADVKLNKSDKEYKTQLLICNDNGILFCDKGLFVFSCFDEEDLVNSGIEVKNKKHIGDITL